jgi:hypothetical protein
MSTQLAVHFRAARLYKRKLEAARKKLMKRADSMTSAELRQKLSDLRVPCGRCKGTSALEFGRDGRMLTVACDADAPCATSRSLDRGQFVLLPETLRSANAELTQLMSAVVELKLRRAYGLVDRERATTEFEALRGRIEALEKRRDTVRSVLDERTQPVVRREEAALARAALDVEQAAIIEDLRSWRATGSQHALRAAVERYAQAAVPLTEQLARAKYALRTVLVDDGVATLVEEPTTLAQLDVSVDRL